MQPTSLARLKRANNATPMRKERNATREENAARSARISTREKGHGKRRKAEAYDRVVSLLENGVLLRQIPPVRPVLHHVVQQGLYTPY